MDKDKIVRALEIALAMAKHEITNGTQAETPCVDASEVYAKCLEALEELRKE